MKTVPPVFLECEGTPGSPLTLLGVPFDGTASFRSGARFGPGALREASRGLETYSPDLDLDLAGVRTWDAGDLDLPFGNPERAVKTIETAAREVLARGNGLVAIGGEHLITLPLVRVQADAHPGLTLVQFDAHADLRGSYLGEPLSHATVMRRCLEVVRPDRLLQVGIRSGTRDEFSWMGQHQTRVEAHAAALGSALARAEGPLYLTVDLDVFDPSHLPGTGTPEPGGIGWEIFAECLGAIRRSGRPLVGADVVELAPTLDPTGASAVWAAKVVREVLLVMGDQATETRQPRAGDNED